MRSISASPCPFKREWGGNYGNGKRWQRFCDFSCNGNRSPPGPSSKARRQKHHVSSQKSCSKLFSGFLSCLLSNFRVHPCSQPFHTFFSELDFYIRPYLF